MNELKDKDTSIREVIAKLQSELGTSFFDIVDHWEADLCAVGIARPDNHEVLVYISTCSLPEHGYFVSLELPSVEEDFPYQAAGEFDDLDFEALVSIIKRHLKVA
jgi:hypothetical protein